MVNDSVFPSSKGLPHFKQSIISPRLYYTKEVRDLPDIWLPGKINPRVGSQPDHHLYYTTKRAKSKKLLPVRSEFLTICKYESPPVMRRFNTTTAICFTLCTNVVFVSGFTLLTSLKHAWSPHLYYTTKNKKRRHPKVPGRASTAAKLPKHRPLRITSINSIQIKFCLMFFNVKAPSEPHAPNAEIGL